MVAPPVTPSAVFEPDGDGRYVPTEAASGPWHPDMLHGGAVSALLAGRLDDPERVTTRILVEILGPVPRAPLAVEVAPPDGGKRVVRQSAVLRADGAPVARAFALRMRRADLALPPEATAHEVVFDPGAVPALDAPNDRARKHVGWTSFDAAAVATVAQPRPAGGSGVDLWVKLLLPMVAGHPPSPLEGVVAAADFATAGTYTRIDFAQWSYMSTDLVVSLARPPAAAGWVGLHCDGLVHGTGTGLSVATLHDAHGRLGQSSQSLLVEPRRRPSTG